MFRLLIPLDGSKRAEDSIALLSVLKPLGDLHVLLINVLDEAEEWRNKALEPGDRDWNLRSAYLEKVASEVRSKLGIGVETQILWGSRATALLEEAARYAPDLLVISTHGRSGLERWRIGSVADKVIRSGSCNTLVLGPHAVKRPEPAVRSILVPLDGSVLAEEAMPIAKNLAEALEAQIHLLRAISPQVIGEDVYGFSYSPETFDALVKGAQEYIAKAGKRLGAAKAVSVTGSPADCLIDYVENNAIDLIVMTSHGRGGLARMALGSVTDRLLRGPAPVLVVRPLANKAAY